MTTMLYNQDIMTNTQKKQVLIVGGGFGGVKAALELSKQQDVSITLLSDQPNFRYYPALYHTATGGLHAQTSIPLDKIINEQVVTLLLGTAEKLDRKKKILTTKEGRHLSYDILILALGVVTNYFGIAGLEEYSYGIKSWEQIQRFKHHLHQQLTDDHQPDSHYVIVGAGPTGIELAGALPAYLERVLRMHHVRKHKVHIEVIEAAPRLLPRSSPRVSAAVGARLKSLGIELKLGQSVQGETAEALMVSGKPITSKTVIWTAGTSNHPFFTANTFTMADHGKVAVNGQMRSEKDIYVIGDNASTPFSGLAETAIRDAIFIAEDIGRRIHRQSPKTYHQRPPITVVPVGHNWAAVEWKGKSLTGQVGWWLREAADWVAFHDIEPWWKATEQWMTEFGSEETCPTCTVTAGI